MTLTSIFRIIKRDSVSLITNMTGLSFGLAAAILLTVFIQYELSFDKHFKNSERIYRLNSIWTDKGESLVLPINLRAAYTDIPGQVAGVERAIQVYQGGRPEVKYRDNRFEDLRLLYSDPGFFELFNLKLIYGSLEDVLAGINEVIITEEIACRILGRDDVVGESIQMGDQSYMVSAVIENIPANTHFQFDMLMPMGAVPNLERLGGLEFFTYYLLEEGSDHESVLKIIREQNSSLLAQRFANYEGSTFSSSTEPLKRLHLYTAAIKDLTPSGNMKTILNMLAIAIIVLVLALSNFINLYILNGARRSREIGIRKVNGAERKTLIGQFYLETLVIVTISFAAGVIITLVLIPDFGRIMQRESFIFVLKTPMLYIILLGVYLVTILISGSYPALMLSRSKVIPLIQGTVNPAGDKKMLLKIVSVFQISITMILLATLIGINAQIRYLKHLSPGYNPENIVVIHNLNEQLINHYPAMRDRLLSIPGVEQVAASGHFIGLGYSGQGIRMYGDSPSQNKTISEYRIHPGLCDLYQFKLINGRFFDPDRISDRSGVILNEAAVQMLGSTPEEIVGESVTMWEDPMDVIGVIEDFYYETAANDIQPLMLTAYADRIRNIPVRISAQADITETLDLINRTMKSFDQDYIMIHEFASDIYKKYYTAEERVRNILGAGTLLSIIIVIMGIYALVTHNIISRTKEIGIRKVMGGSTSDMITMIYKSTLLWTVIASVMALPLCWMYLNKWLNGYVVRIPLYWWIFVSSILLVLLLETMITLGQTWKAASRNPVDALRYE
jgi:putative ABC transport system permease protein